MLIMLVHGIAILNVQVHDKIWQALLGCSQKVFSNPSFNSKLLWLLSHE